jgi:hypothetical protein
VGFAGHYRFGEDPDAPQAMIRSVRISPRRQPTSWKETRFRSRSCSPRRFMWTSQPRQCWH